MTTALASTVLVGTAHADSTHRYRLVELGTLGGEFSAARSVNDADEVVGYSQVAGNGESHAFLWCAGTMTDLGTLPGGASSVALDINNRGQIVGQATTATGAGHAVMWQRGVVSDLGTFGGADSTAVAVNERGQVVGTSFTASGDLHGFLWQNGVMTDLGDFNPVDINDRGQIAGYLSPVGAVAASYRWQRGKMTGLGSLGGYVYATAIDGSGNVVGRAGVPSGDTVSDTGFRWHRGTMAALAAPPDGVNGEAVSANDRGQVVGYDQVPANGWQLRPLLWKRGTVVDLTTAGVSPGIIWKINNRGHLAGLRTGLGGPPLNPHAVLYL